MSLLIKQKKNEPRLSRIIVVLTVTAGMIYGGMYVMKWWNGDATTGTVEAGAPQHLENAAQYIAEGNYTEAEKLLAPIIKHAHHDTMTPDAYKLMADIAHAKGDSDRAVAYLDQAVAEYPNSPNRPQITLAKARLLEDAGKTGEAAALYELARSSFPKAFQPVALNGLARHAVRQSKLVEARDLYQESVTLEEWDTATWNEAVDGVGQLNVQLVFSPTETPDSKVYTVESGDSLTSIGMKLNTTIGMLTRANNIPEDAGLQVGQTLKWTPKDFRVVIERTTNRLFVLDNTGVFKRYNVGLGKDGYATTLGSYKIGSKQKDPTWFKPGEGAIPPGDPDNQLGTRWMPLVPVEEGLPTDLGIHGALDPATVGEYSSNGCARMAMPDVEELYDLIVRSTPVTIVDVVPDELRG